MTHILLCTTSFPDEAFADGQEAAGAFVADFAHALAQQVQVTVVAPSLADSVQISSTLTIHRYAVSSLPLSLLKPQHPANWLPIFKTLRAGQQAVRQVVESERIDHIFALWALPSGYWARVMLQETAVPYTIWALGSDIWGLGRVPLVRIVLKRVLQDSAHRFADGYLLAQETERIGGRPCSFLPSTRRLSVPQLRPFAAAPPYKLAFLGRWHANKGADILLDALRQLDDADWQQIEAVRFCGGGPLEAEVKTAVSHLQTANRPVQLSGYLNRQEAIELYLWADYLIIPSRIESIPVIFSDAMQTDLPVISTPVGDLPRLLQTFNVGVLATEASATAVASAIRTALAAPPAQFADGVAQAKAAFDIEQSVQTFLQTIGAQQ